MCTGLPAGSYFSITGSCRDRPSPLYQCGLCLDACPQGAIMKVVAVSKEELQATVAVLKKRTNSIIERIEELR